MTNRYDLPPEDDWFDRFPEPIEPERRIDRLKTGLVDAIQSARDFVSEHLPQRAGADSGAVDDYPITDIWGDVSPRSSYTNDTKIESLDTLSPRSSRSTSMFDDDWLSVPQWEYTDDRTRLEKIRDGAGNAASRSWELIVRKKRVAAAVLALSGVIIGGVVVASSAGEKSKGETAASSTTTTEPGYTYDPDTGEVIITDGGVVIDSQDSETTTTTQPIESATTKKFEPLILDREDLPDVGSAPIVLTPEQQAEQPGVGLGQALSGIDTSPEAYPESQFVGSYKSLTGIEFNFYSTNLDHSGQRYELNPVAVEFVLSLLKQELPNAPENDTKQNVLRNLDRIQDGEERRVLDIIIDMSDDPSCIDASYQVIKYAEDACAALGVTHIVSGTDERTSEQMPVLVTDVGDRHWETQEDGKEIIVSNRDKGQGDETATLMHEVGVHALDEFTTDEAFDPDSTVNTYKEGDDAHEESAYMGLGGEPDDFDLEGAKGKPIDLLKVIKELAEADKLPPIFVPAH